MALITCPHCGKPVSDRAATCPNCGCNPKEKGVAEKNNDVTPKEDSSITPLIEQEVSSSNRGKIIIIFLLIAILAAIVGILGYQKYCDLGYGSSYYEAPIDTAAVDTVATTDDTQAKMDEFKNFRTLDLSAFMLHGKVKEFLITPGGNAHRVYKFNEQGELIDVQSDSYKIQQIRREGNKLIISFQNPSLETDCFDTEYEVDSSGRLISCIFVSEDSYYYEHKYSQFDEKGWPTYSTNSHGSDPDDEETTSHINYKQVDEYGNWTARTIEGEGSEYRTIKYYPID